MSDVLDKIVEEAFERSDVQNVEVDLHEWHEQLKKNCEVFVNFFLYDQITYGVPDFHLRIWDFMTNQDIHRFACAVPRGHAKTTLAKLAVVWHFLFTDARFIVYVSNTETIAVEAVSDIANYMESANFVKTFGMITWDKRKAGRGHYQFMLNGKRCILMARGANQQVRGLNIDNQRPQVAIVDDLEDEDNTASEQLHKKLKKWFFGTFIKALDKRWNKVIYIGNLIGENSIIELLINLRSWVSMRLGCLLEDGTPLWPELWPLEAILADYEEYRAMGMVSTWFAEMMNLVTAGENAIIKAEEIYYLPPIEPGEQKTAFITIDPIPDKSETTDEAAIVVHALVEDPNTGGTVVQIVDYVEGNFDPHDLYIQTKTLCFRWGAAIVGIEAVLFSTVLKYYFEIMAKLDGLHDMEVVKLISGTTAKMVRMTAWASMIKQKAYALTEGDIHLTANLLKIDRFRKRQKDDLTDAASYGPLMLENYMGLIMERRLGFTINVEPKREGAVCAA